MWFSTVTLCTVVGCRMKFPVTLIWFDLIWWFDLMIWFDLIWFVSFGLFLGDLLLVIFSWHSFSFLYSFFLHWLIFYSTLAFFVFILYFFYIGLTFNLIYSKCFHKGSIVCRGHTSTALRAWLFIADYGT